MPEGRQDMVLGRTSEGHGRSRWPIKVDFEHQGFPRSEVSRSDVLRSGVPRSDADFGCPGSAIVRLLGGIRVIGGEKSYSPNTTPDFRVRAACRLGRGK